MDFFALGLSLYRAVRPIVSRGRLPFHERIIRCSISFPGSLLKGHDWFLFFDLDQFCQKLLILMLDFSFALYNCNRKFRRLLDLLTNNMVRLPLGAMTASFVFFNVHNTWHVGLGVQWTLPHLRLVLLLVGWCGVELFTRHCHRSVMSSRVTYSLVKLLV